MLQHACHERPGPGLRQVHRRTAADREHRPQKAEHDQEQQRQDVIGNRMQPHRDHAHQLQAAAFLVVAGEPAQPVAEHPGDDGRDHQQPGGPRQRAGDQRRDRRRKRRHRRPEIGAQDPFPEHQILLQRRAFETVELAQRNAHLLDRFGRGIAERRDRRDRLLDRIDRRGMGDHIGKVDADEDHEHELHQPLGDVGEISAHEIPRCEANFTGLDSSDEAVAGPCQRTRPAFALTS